MFCRDIPEAMFETIAAELTNANRRDGKIETITGYHEHHGLTILVRDATRCMVLVVDPSGLDAWTGFQLN